MILSLEIGLRLKVFKFWKFVTGIVFLLAFTLPTMIGMAQDEIEGPIYIVQEGDSLWDIAVRFRVSLDDLARVNGITDPSQLTAGARLIIPGLEGIRGILTTRVVPYGETLRSVSRRYQVPPDVLIRLNHLASPAELYAGTNVVILEQEDGPEEPHRSLLAPGQSLFELAIASGVSPWHYVFANDLQASWRALPGDVFHLPQKELLDSPSPGPGALPAEIERTDLVPTPFVQGKVAVIQFSSPAELTLRGSLNEYALNFFPYTDDRYIGFQGIHAMTEPGLYTLDIQATLPANGPYQDIEFSYSQPVLIRSGGYAFDPVLIVSPETIDPAVTVPEDAQWSALAAPVTPEKRWEGIFKSPAPEIFADCWPSLFGNRRSYNGSAYTYFHTGLDFCGGVGIEILAPASGMVVFAGPLTVRGNATMIDHGWGVYSGYMHQSEVLVAVGDIVQPGQVIGLVGGTGRVTGPHLHWEIWAGGVQVDPLDWLERAFPDP